MPYASNQKFLFSPPQLLTYRYIAPCMWYQGSIYCPFLCFWKLPSALLALPNKWLMMIILILNGFIYLSKRFTQRLPLPEGRKWVSVLFLIYTQFSIILKLLGVQRLNSIYVSSHLWEDGLSGTKCYLEQ